MWGPHKNVGARCSSCAELEAVPRWEQVPRESWLDTEARQVGPLLACRCGDLRHQLCVPCWSVPSSTIL